MKKLFAILLTLLMVLSLPVAVAAEETTTAFDDSETGVVETNADSVEVTSSAEETEPSAETEGSAKTQFGFYPESMKETLPAMGMGMLGIFLVTSVIILSVLVLSKIGKKEED